MIPPSDLCMDHVVTAIGSPAVLRPKGSAPCRFLATFGQGFVAFATGVRNIAHGERLTSTDPGHRQGLAFSDTAVLLLAFMIEASQPNKNALLLVPPTWALHSPISLSGFLAGHWPPQNTTLEYAAGPEIEASARILGSTEIKTANATFFLFGNTPPKVERKVVDPK